MQKTIAIILCIVLAGAIFGCSKNAFSPHTPDQKKKVRVFPKRITQMWIVIRGTLSIQIHLCLSHQWKLQMVI